VSKPSRATRIVVVDDHPLVRRGLRDLLAGEEGLDLVAELGDAEALLAHLGSSATDVVVLDLSLPGTRSLDVLRRLRTDHPGVAVLVLSMHPEDSYALRALRAGAAGYVEKSTAPEELVAAIRSVAGGRRHLSSRLAERLLGGRVVEEPASSTHQALSERELQVLRRIGDGSTVSEIAGELSLSVKTVSTYRARLLAKMGLRTNSELTRYVFEHDLLPL
jgi:two-component system invasion response regulator UvrY